MLTVIQARMRSSRLAGKVLRPLGGIPVLSWVVRAAKESGTDSTIVVATTEEPDDDAVEELAHDLGVACVRGETDDVLLRFRRVLDQFGDQPLIRLTADCPLLDPALIRMAAALFKAGSPDYVSTVTPRTLPRGMDVEILSAEALHACHHSATGAHRIHVTSFIRDNPAYFRVAGVTFSPRSDDLRLTLDTPEDAVLLDAVVAELGSAPIEWRRAVELLRHQPNLAAINQHVRQKLVNEG